MGVLLSESEMDSVMRAFDHNHNGKVDFLEFYGQLARQRYVSWMLGVFCPCVLIFVAFLLGSQLVFVRRLVT